VSKGDRIVVQLRADLAGANAQPLVIEATMDGRSVRQREGTGKRKGLIYLEELTRSGKVCRTIRFQSEAAIAIEERIKYVEKANKPASPAKQPLLRVKAEELPLEGLGDGQEVEVLSRQPL
jgi:hypothetical protein